MSSVAPLAGLCGYEDAARPGLSVEHTVQLLRRLARIERRTLLVVAAQLNAVPEWEVKCALALHLWQDAEHCPSLRERVAEMRKPPHPRVSQRHESSPENRMWTPSRNRGASRYAFTPSTARPRIRNGEAASGRVILVEVGI